MKVRTRLKVGAQDWIPGTPCQEQPSLGQCKQCCADYFEQVGETEPPGWCREACKANY